MPMTATSMVRVRSRTAARPRPGANRATETGGALSIRSISGSSAPRETVGFARVGGPCALPPAVLVERGGAAARLARGGLGGRDARARPGLDGGRGGGRRHPGDGEGEDGGGTQTGTCRHGYPPYGLSGIRERVGSRRSIRRPLSELAPPILWDGPTW